MLVKSLHARARSILRNGQWALLSIYACSILSTVAVLIVTVILGSRIESWAEDTNGLGCSVDGVPRVNASLAQRADSNYFKLSLALTPTLAFGDFTFAQAKGIDLTWDLVVGRGCQALLAYLVYPVIRRSMRHMMEKRSLPLTLFGAMAFARLSLTTLASLRSGIYYRRTSQARFKNLDLTVLGIVWICLYISLFPTITSIMTGYQPRFVGYLADHESSEAGSLVPFSNLGIPDAVVYDNERLGLASPVITGSTYNSDAILTLSGYAANWTSINLASQAWSEKLKTDGIESNDWHLCDRMFGKSDLDIRINTNIDWNFTITRGPGCWPTSSVYSTINIFRNVSFLAPNPLSIYLPKGPWRTYAPHALLCDVDVPAYRQWPAEDRSDWCNTTNASDAEEHWGKWHELPEPGSGTLDPLAGESPSNTGWYALGTKQVISAEVLAANSVCEPGTSYRWGFSATFLLVFSATSLLFVMTILALDWAIRRTDDLEDKQHYFSTYRDAIDIVEPLRARYGDDLNHMSGQRLDAFIKEDNLKIQIAVNDVLTSDRSIAQDIPGQVLIERFTRGDEFERLTGGDDMQLANFHNCRRTRDNVTIYQVLDSDQT